MQSSEYLDQLLASVYTQAAPGNSTGFNPATPGNLQAAAGQNFIPVAGAAGAPGSGFTVQCWFQQAATVVAGTSYPMVTVWDGSTPNKSWALSSSGPHQQIRLSLDGMTSHDVLDGTFTLVPGTWYMQTMRWNGAQALIGSRNGVETIIDSTITGTCFAGNSPLRVGALMGATGLVYFAGAIFGVRMWNRSLTDQELVASYGSGHYIPYANLGNIITDGSAKTLPNGLIHDWPLSEQPPGPYVDRVQAGGFNLVPVGSIAAGPAPPL